MRGEWFCQFGKEMGRKFRVKCGWEGKGNEILLNEMGRNLRVLREGNRKEIFNICLACECNGKENMRFFLKKIKN